MTGLQYIFKNPKEPGQRRYEAIRAIEIDGLSTAEAAKKYGYRTNTLYSLIRDLKAGKLDIFPKGKQYICKRQTPDCICKQIAKHRKRGLSAVDIQAILKNEGYKLSDRTIERILSDYNFKKLKRRNKSEITYTKKMQLPSKRAAQLDFKKLDPFNIDCPIAGIFFFVPYIIESNILDIVKKCKLPKSSVIDCIHANLAMLLLKLIGSERLSHINNFNHDPGLAVFAGLSILPKSSYMTSYSCRTSEKVLLDFQTHLLKNFVKNYPEFYKSDFINIDFHSIPHYGEESKMEKVWCGAKHQAMKGANTIFAQDSESNVILYTRADILRKNESQEIKNFVAHWKKIKRDMRETLVFDCKLTNYETLNDLTLKSINFITLRKRNKKLAKETNELKDEKWEKVYIPIPKRKHKLCKVYESEVILKKGYKPVRQIIIKDHGRAEPTYVITNNKQLKLKEVLIVYAKRWRVENKLSELVSFFNLNALSSPLMIRIHFDILWTVVADALYHRLAQNLPRFEKERANSIFRKFINMPGKVIFTGEEFIIKIRKRAHTPILMGIKELDKGVRVPWLDNKLLKIQWTA